MLPNVPLPNISFSVELLVKVLFMVVIMWAVVYSLLIWRQVVLASKVLKTKATPWVRLMAMIYVAVVTVVSVIVSIILWA